MNKDVIKHALVNAGVTTAYILLVVALVFNAETIFRGMEPEDNVFVGVAMLLLFVISAAVTSSAVFGRPILWYLDGKKREAVTLLGTTLFFLLIFFLLIISII
jgi:hypothetical protein